MSQRLAHVVVLVRDYDEVIAFYTKILGFFLASDQGLSESKRWIVVNPLEPTGCSLLLAGANTDKKSVGRQGSGRVWRFLHTDNF